MADLQARSSNTLEVRELCLTHAGPLGLTQLLQDISFEVGRGEILGLVGESGSGKSITAMSVLQLLPPNLREHMTGAVSVLGSNVMVLRERDMERIRGARASMIFQEPMSALNPSMRIGHQLQQVLLRHNTISRSQARRRALDLLEEMHIQAPTRVMRAYPFELSGGMRQRVLIAMAFSANPGLIVADEPTTALDVTVQAQVLKLLTDSAKSRGTSVLFISHDLGVISSLCDRVCVMYAGRIIESGAAASVLRQPMHPYTRGLILSLPEFGSPKGRLVAIPGTVPNGLDRPDGCGFRNRCSMAGERCLSMPPLGVTAEVGHLSACWFADRQPPLPAPNKAEPAVAAKSSPQPEVVLSVRDVTVEFPAGRDWLGRPMNVVRALGGVSFDIARGETFGVVGESGCGKSTLADVVMALRQPTSGSVTFNGHDVHAASPARLKVLRRGFQIVFQDPQSSLNPRLPAWRIISEPLTAEDRRRSPRDLRRLAIGIADRVGLRADQMERYPHEFSGGQRQRIAIARALIMRPALLVLDEPTSALDVSVQAQTLNLLMDLQAEFDLSYLFISHNIAVVRHVSDRVAVMSRGRIVEMGNSEQIIGEPLHPYTRALLQSVPSLSQYWGTAPATSGPTLPAGWIPAVADEQDVNLGRLIEIADGRQIRCFATEGTNNA